MNESKENIYLYQGQIIKYSRKKDQIGISPDRKIANDEGVEDSDLDQESIEERLPKILCRGIYPCSCRTKKKDADGNVIKTEIALSVTESPFLIK